MSDTDETGENTTEETTVNDVYLLVESLEITVGEVLHFLHTMVQVALLVAGAILFSSIVVLVLP
jgi:hypothetical protein